MRASTLAHVAPRVSQRRSRHGAGYVTAFAGKKNAAAVLALAQSVLTKLYYLFPWVYGYQSGQPDPHALFPFQ